MTLTVEDAEHGDVTKWSVNGAGTAKNILDTDTNSRVIEFHASGKDSVRVVYRVCGVFNLAILGLFFQD